MSGAPRLTVAAPDRPAYLNPNLWNVAGPDPAGPLGSAVAGEANWCRARVANAGTAPGEATVRFFWCPGDEDTLCWDGYLARPAGIAGPVTLAPGETREVAAAAPWSPPEPGIASLVAVVSAPDDPAPPARPGDEVPSEDRHVAMYVVHVVAPGEADAAEP